MAPCDLRIDASIENAVLPEDLAEALKRHKLAQSTFENMSYSPGKEYDEGIWEAPLGANARMAG